MSEKLRRGNWYEFGLLAGRSTADTFRRLTQANLAPRRLFGFDSFVGLPSGDRRFVKGQFSSTAVVQNITGRRDVTAVEVASQLPVVT